MSVWRHCRIHPLAYLALLVLILTLVNLMGLKHGFIANPKKREADILAKSKFRRVGVKLMADSEETILSRIQFPDRDTALLAGKTHVNHGLTSEVKSFSDYIDRRPKLTLGISSVARSNATGKIDYLIETLGLLDNQTSEAEKTKIVIVVSLADPDPEIRDRRLSEIATRFPDWLKSGLLQVIAPPENNYPKVNFDKIFRTYGDSIEVARWRSKLALDFAFLFAYSQGLSPLFLNLEDDTIPEVNFVTSTLAFVNEKSTEGPWNSLMLSEHLSIGRLYRSESLPKLVAFILISYTSQPVDFLMHYFDLVQMADGFSRNPARFRRDPPLVRHRGRVSTKFPVMLKVPERRRTTTS